MDGPALLPPGEAAALVEPDLPAPVVERAEGVRCLVLARRPILLPAGERRLVAHELVRSERRTGTRRVPNPDYNGAREEGAAEGDEHDGRIMSTGDPGLDLIGIAAGSIIHGLSRLRRDRGEAAAGRAAGIGRYVDEPVLEPYTYEINTYEMDRAATFDLTLVDDAAGRAHVVRHTLRERRTFPVAKGRHKADRSLLDGTGPEAYLPEDVTVFASSPPRPRLSELLRVLIEAGGEGRPTVRDQLLARPAVSAPAELVTAPAKRGRGRLTVETPDGPAAEGLWIDAERVAVPSAALGRSSVVQLQDVDGVRIFGMVERVDPASGSAVVRIGRQARPAAGEQEAPSGALTPRAGR